MKGSSPKVTEPVLERARVLSRYQYLDHDLLPCEVAIGLGGFDLGVATRCADLYHRGLFPLLVFSGGNNAYTVGRFPRGEAVHYREHALGLGVPENAMMTEPRATNTGENILFSRRLLHESGLHPKSVLLVGTVDRRPSATARKLWPEAEIRCAADPVGLDDRLAAGADPWTAVEALVGETQRLIDYPALGHLVQEEIPAPVLDAHLALRAAGFGHSGHGRH